MYTLLWSCFTFPDFSFCLQTMDSTTHNKARQEGAYLDSHFTSQPLTLLMRCKEDTPF